MLGGFSSAGAYLGAHSRPADGLFKLAGPGVGTVQSSDYMSACVISV